MQFSLFVPRAVRSKDRKLQRKTHTRGLGQDALVASARVSACEDDGHAAARELGEVGIDVGHVGRRAADGREVALPACQQELGLVSMNSSKGGNLQFSI